MTFPAFVRRLGLGLLALLAGLGLWAFWLEPASLRVSTYDLPLRDAAPPLASLRIAALSDLHAGAPFIDAAKLRRVVALTNAAEPDLIVIAGDTFRQNVWRGADLEPAAVAAALSGLRAPLGVYAVLGNHDSGRQTGLYLNLLRHSGITPLNNEVHRIAVGSQHFWLAGFADFETGGPQVAATLALITDSAPIIAATHNPKLFPSVPSRVGLMITGHTHGGQVRLPIFSRVLLRETHTHEDDLPYLRGHYREQTDLFITTGIGTSGLPVRFRVAPEISLLTLRQDAAP